MSSSHFSLPPADPDLDALFMRRALELAVRGQGWVEPNPMVGCVLVRDGEVVGEGSHRKFGGPHAEVEAISVAGGRAQGGTAYVTLEPCSHHGKTPPCVDALLKAGVARVVCAMSDPFPKVAGEGIAALRSQGVLVEVGLLEEEARRINAPYLKWVGSGRAWVIAKWAMTLDGKIATRTGDSRWISSEASRAIVHQLRGRVDAILVGSGTARQDDPLLIARPAGPRVATRIVVDRKACLPSDSQLVKTAREAPVLIAAGNPPAENVARLTQAACEVFSCGEKQHPHSGSLSEGVDLLALLDELGRRRMTNVLVEGGSTLLGSLFDAEAIDEVCVFIAPKVIGGKNAPSPIGGAGFEKIASALALANPEIRQVGDDVLVWGRIAR